MPILTASASVTVDKQNEIMATREVAITRGLKSLIRKGAGQARLKRRRNSKMGLMQKDTAVSYRRGIAGTYKAKNATTVETVCITVDTEDARDSALWDAEISESLDVLEMLADKAMANYDAGLTRKISG